MPAKIIKNSINSFLSKNVQNKVSLKELGFSRTAHFQLTELSFKIEKKLHCIKISAL